MKTDAIGKTCLAIGVAVVLTLLSAGCVPVQDAISRAAGLPTSKEVEKIKHELAIKDREIVEYGAAAALAERIADNADKEALNAKASRDSAQATAAAIAKQMSESADDPLAFKALKKAFDEANTTIELFLGLALSAEETATLARAEVAERRAGADLLGRRVAALEMELEGVSEDRAAMFAAAGESIDTIGEELQALGIPSAQAASARINGIVGVLGGLVFGGGPAGITTFLERRRRRRAERVITVTEEHGLIIDDPERKAVARAALSEKEIDVLARAKARARRPSPQRLAA